MNTTLVKRFSKKQSTVEISVFGVGFAVMKQDVDALRGLQCQLRMIGIPISGSLYICWDNASVVPKTFRPQSVFRKKSNSVCYHAVYESVAIGKSLVRHTFHEENVADLMTKSLYRQKRK